MIKIKFKLCIFLMLFFAIDASQGQIALNVTKNDNSQTAFGVNDIKKLTFSSGNLIVSTNNGSSQSFVLTDIRHLSFNNLVTVVRKQQESDTKAMLIYPNPASEVVNLQFVAQENETDCIQIISTKGKVVYHNIVNSQSGLNTIIMDISDLPAGMYICHLSNGKSAKVLKVIKMNRQ